MLGVQMIAAHRTAMNLYLRAERAVASGMSLQEWNHTLNHAGKLTRTYIMGMDSLNKHRGKGQQKVTVEHLHVHTGVQAAKDLVRLWAHLRIVENTGHGRNSSFDGFGLG